MLHIILANLPIIVAKLPVTNCTFSAVSATHGGDGFVSFHTILLDYSFLLSWVLTFVWVVFTVTLKVHPVLGLAKRAEGTIGKNLPPIKSHQGLIHPG
jgi:hypothetical protein